MSKPADRMVFEMMLQFPSSVPNATVAVHQMLLVLGSGYVWSDAYGGCLVREDDAMEEDFRLETEAEPLYKSLEKAVLYVVKDYFYNRVLTLGDELERAVGRDDGEFLLSESSLEPLTRYIHQVFTAKDRVTDFSIPCEGYRFYPISKESNLNNIPDNVRWDWMFFIESFLEVLDKYPESVRDPEHLLPGIQDRVRSIRKARSTQYLSELENDTCSCGADSGTKDT